MSAPEYCFLWIDWWPLCMTKAEWSGWFQAIGAAIAILAAAAIAAYQAGHSRKLEGEKRTATEVQRLNIVKALAVRCFTLAKEVVKAIDEPSKETMEVVSPELMRDVGSTLMDLPIFDVPGGIVALDVMTLGRTIGNLAALWDTTAKEAHDLKRPPTSDQMATIKSFAAEIADVAESARNECKAEIRARSGKLN
jgi:hypothetical protein